VEAENRVVRRIFGHEEEEAAGGCRQFYNKELIICSLHQIL
jgi:hypothetical protein